MLLGAALGILSRINDNTYERRLLSMRLVYTPILAALILSILGSTKIFPISSPSKVSDGYEFVKAGAILFLVGLLFLWAIMLWCVTNINKVEQFERRLVWVIAWSMPWQTVRVIYTLICGFSENSKYFSQFGTNFIGVVIHALLGLLPEIVIVATYLYSGMTAKRLEHNVSDLKEPAYTQGPIGKGSQMQPVQGA